MEFCYLSEILFVWVLLPDYEYFCDGMVFLPYLCRNMSNFAAQDLFALFAFDDFFCAHFRENTWNKLSIPQWFVDAPGMFRGGMGAVAF